jgi:hypothetical protein
MNQPKSYAIYANGKKTRSIKVKTLESAFRYFNKYAKQQPVTMVEGAQYLGMMAWQTTDGTMIELRIEQGETN